MIGKALGAVLIVFGCGYFGFHMAIRIKQEEQSLHQLIAVLDYMQCEIQFHMTPLPDLCRQAGMEQQNWIGKFFRKLALELEDHTSTDVSYCVHHVLASVPELQNRCRHALELLGTSLGRFDVQGQINGLEAVRVFCRGELEELAVNRDVRLRSYQTLGVCAGAALAILFV